MVFRVFIKHTSSVSFAIVSYKQTKRNIMEMESVRFKREPLM